MQLMLGKSGYALVCGLLRSGPELNTCKNGRQRCTAGLVVDVRRDAQGKPLKDQQGHPINVWANLTAWGPWAKLLGTAERGDAVLAIGKLHTWEQDGQTYKDLAINDFGFLNVIHLAFLADQDQTPPPQPQTFQELDDDDGELPF